MNLDVLTAVSPIDGRYRGKTESLANQSYPFPLQGFGRQTNTGTGAMLHCAPVPAMYRGYNVFLYERLLLVKIPKGAGVVFTEIRFVSRTACCRPIRIFRINFTFASRRDKISHHPLCLYKDYSYLRRYICFILFHCVSDTFRVVFTLLSSCR